MHFKQVGWIGSSKKATAQELIDTALNRIKYDATKYTVFIDILKGMAGMDQIVPSIEGKANLYKSIIIMVCYILCYISLTCSVAMRVHVEAAHFPDPTSTHVM